MTIAEIIGNEFEHLDTFLAEFEVSMQGIQSEVFDEVLAALAKMPQSEGSFIVSDRAKAVILKLEERILELIQSGKYSKEYRKLVQNFDQLEEIRKQVSAYVNPASKLAVFKAATSPIRKAYINQLSTSLGSKEAFGFNIINPIKDILFEHSTLGLTFKQAANKLFQYSMGFSPNGKGGKIQQYAGQIARDSLFGFTGAVDKEIGEFIGAKDVNYLGNLIKDSRPQCVRWVDKLGGFIPAKDVKAEIRWAKENGEGYTTDDLARLNEKTFSIIKGGRNCRHRIVYSNGPASDRIKSVQNEYDRRSKELNEQIEKKLTGITAKRYAEQKGKVEQLVNLYGKQLAFK